MNTLEAFLPTPHEFNLMAIALNEHLADIEACDFVPYIENAFDILV